MAEFCPFCMRPGSGKYCKYSGGEIAFRGKEFQLPVGTHLMGSEVPYLIGASIGQGGFGVTYAALNCASGERVAIKEYFPIYWSDRSINGKDVLAKDKCGAVYAAGRDKFLKEAKTIHALKHLKSIVNVYDFFRANNTAYIVMEYLEGETLAQLVKRKERLTVEELWKMLRPLMEDIHEMHGPSEEALKEMYRPLTENIKAMYASRRVLHRDIAPDNIMVMKDGSLKLMDFGSARSMQKNAHGMTMFMKPGFSPAEQCLGGGEQGPYTDVYSMAATIYYCLCGKIPAQATDRLSEITNGHADPLKRLRDVGVEIPAAADTAIWRAMAVYSDARTQTMQDFCNQFYRGAVVYHDELAFLPFSAVPEERVLEIGWRGKRQPNASYFLFRRINDGKYRVISSGNQIKYCDRLPNAAKCVQYRLELQDASGTTVGSCESRPINVEGWPAGKLLPKDLLLPMLVAAAGILLAALIVALAGAF